MKARWWIIHCDDSRWGNRVMETLAKERFDSDPSIECITVYEHAGWSLSWNRAGVVVGTANDMAQLSKEAYEWGARFKDRDLVGYTRDGSDVFYPGYYPKLAEVA